VGKRDGCRTAGWPPFLGLIGQDSGGGAGGKGE